MKFVLEFCKFIPNRTTLTGVRRCINHGGVGLAMCGGSGRRTQAHLKCGTISPPCGTAGQ